MEPKFLTLDQGLTLHRDGICEHGGDPGTRDPGLVESAVMAPQQTFGGELLYRSLEEIAAAYWYGLAINHGFIDGNKRVSLAACDTFLLMNGLELTFSNDQAAEVTLAIACGNSSHEELVQLIRHNCRPYSGPI